MKDYDLIMASDAAGILKVGPGRVRQLADEGVLKCIRTTAGIRLFYKEDVKRLARERLLNNV